MVIAVFVSLHSGLAQAAGTCAIERVIIGGVGGTAEQLKDLNEALPNSISIVTENKINLAKATPEAAEMLKRYGIINEDGSVRCHVDLIGHSQGGNIARSLDGMFPGLARSIITVSTPNNFSELVIIGIPNFIASLIGPNDKESSTPFYAIAGVKKNVRIGFFTKYLRTDGIITEKAATHTANGRKIDATFVFEGDNDVEHSKILSNQKVIEKIKSLLGVAPEEIVLSALSAN